MVKRVGVARALVVEPEILIDDEPTTGLHPITSRKVDALIDETRERFLVTSLVMTHDMATAYEIGDRVMLLDHGRFVAEGEVASFFTSDVPAVRTFMDSSAIEPSKLSEKRRTRKSPEEIRSAWQAARLAPPRTVCVPASSAPPIARG